MDDLLHDLQITPHFSSEGHDYVYISLKVEETGYLYNIHIKQACKHNSSNMGLSC